MGAAEGAQPARSAFRRLPEASAVARQWRALTGDRTTPDARRRTLIACSGGADSTALALCLASAARRHVVLAHILHDLRSPVDAAADQAAVAALGDRLDVPFVCQPIGVRDLPGNPEATARRARYSALADLARLHACPFVAVAHQGDDLVETLLMRLIRGSGPRGLAVLRDRRPLVPGVDLIRPMLALSRQQTQAMCRAAGVAWREDATNADTSRWRARLRRDVLPVLESLRPAMRDRIRASASLMHDAATLIESQAEQLLAGAESTPDAPTLQETSDAHHAGVLRWRRGHLATLSPLLLGATLRLAHARLVGPARLDRLDDRAVRAIARALGDPDRRERNWTVAGLHIELDSATLTIRASNPGRHPA